MHLFGKHRATRSSRVPSGPPADGTERVPEAQGDDESKRPRKHGESRIPESVKQSTSNLGTGPVSTNAPGATVQYMPSGPASLPVKDQNGSERHELSDDGGHVERVVSTPETIHNDLEPDNPKGDIPQNATYNAAWEELRRIRHIHHEEMYRTMNMADLMKGEAEDRDRFYQEKYEALVIENDELLQANSASTSRIALLEIQLSLRTVDPDTAPGSDIIDSNITTLLTSIITITTTITTVTTRVERWKHTGTNAEQITISSKELERLSSDLSSTSSRMTKLQQQYIELSRNLGTVRNKLRETMSLCDEKDRTIVTLKTEVVQWKSAEASRTQQIAAIVEEKDRMTGSLYTGVTLWKQPDAVKAGPISTMRGEHDEPPTSLFAPSQIAGHTHALENKMEELRHDLAAANNKNAALRRMYEAQSREVNALRDELNKTSQDKATINFLTAQVDQWKRADTTKAQRITSLSRQIEKLQKHLSIAASEVDQRKHADATQAEQVAAERRDKEKLRLDLAASFSRAAELQGRYDAQSKEIVSIRNELESKASLLEEKDHAISSLTAKATQAEHEDSLKVEQGVAARRDVEQLRHELSGASSRNADLQKRLEAQSKELDSVRDELHRIEILHPDETDIAPAPVEHAVSKHIAHVLETKNKQMEELRRDLTTANARNTEVQRSYEVLLAEVSTLRDELKDKTPQSEGTIKSLTTRVDQWKRADTTKAKQLAALSRRIEELQNNLSTSTSQVTELRVRYETQSREFVTVRNKLQNMATHNEEKDRTITTLMAEVNQWKSVDGHKTKKMASISKQVKALQQDLSTSASQLAELQDRYKRQSRDLVSMRTELQSRTSDLATSASQITQLQQHYDVQSKELTTLHEQLKDPGNKGAVSTLISQLEGWKSSDAVKAGQLDQLRRELATSSSQIESLKKLDVTKTEELTTVHKELEQLRHDLSTSSSQIIEYQQRCAALSARSVELTSQIEQWKGADTARAKELDTTREKVAQLQDELSTSSSRITEFQQRYDVQSAELRPLHEQLQAMLSLVNDKDVDQWKRGDTTKAEELAHASREIERLRRELTVSFSQIEELQKCHAEELEALRQSPRVSEETRRVYERIASEGKDYAAVIKLTTTIDQWLRADAERAEDLAPEPGQRNKENEELRQHLITLKEIYVRAPELREIFHSETTEVQQRFATTTDTYADAIIIQTLQKLNTEVGLTTTFMAEGMMKEFRPRAGSSTSEQLSVVKRVAESIGQTLMDCLRKDERDEVELFLQIAFQVFITYYLRSLISSWTTQTEFNNFIDQTYEQLRKSEAQTTSGRWRSLTRIYISRACMGNPEPLISAAVSGLSAIVVAAGCAPTFSDAESRVSSDYGEKVSSIISIAMEFGKMIGEVVSADFELLTVRPSETFEDTTMENVNGDDSGEGKVSGTESQKVLCSTELGMMKRMQLESGESNTLPVIKAKVILESFLDERV